MRPSFSEIAPWLPPELPRDRSARHRPVDGQRPEHAQTVGTASDMIDKADLPLAREDSIPEPLPAGRMA
jgi:hypothetical protein